MNDILLATIPAALVLVATLSARLLEHRLQSKRDIQRQKLERERETRDAKRKYRENVVMPAREALLKLQTRMGMRSVWEFLSKGGQTGLIFSRPSIDGKVQRIGLAYKKLEEYVAQAD